MYRTPSAYNHPEVAQDPVSDLLITSCCKSIAAQGRSPTKCGPSPVWRFEVKQQNYQYQTCDPVLSWCAHGSMLWATNAFFYTGSIRHEILIGTILVCTGSVWYILALQILNSRMRSSRKINGTSFLRHLNPSSYVNGTAFQSFLFCDLISSLAVAF